MTGGTIRLVHRERPRKDLRICRVAIRAGEIDAMVTRVSRRQMVKDKRCPEVAGVTVVALKLRLEMPGALPDRHRAVMAA